MEPVFKQTLQQHPIENMPSFYSQLQKNLSKMV